MFSPFQSSETTRQDIAPATKGVNERLMSRYIGEQLTTSQPNPHDRLNYGARNLPDMFRNRRLQLQDSIEGFILNGFEFYTYLIPWLVTNEKSVKMNVYRHNVRPATAVPNKGVSRTQTHQTSTKEATVERFGTSFYMEGDLMGTPEGDRQYIRNLMGLAQGCQLHVNEATMAELIDCKNYVQDWMDYRGRRNWVEDVMEMEIVRFAGMAADANFLDQVVQASISAFSLRSITADAVIGWDTLPFLDSMVVSGTKTGFWQMGPDGRDVFVAGPDAITSIKGLPLFLARPFTVNESNGPEQFLARDTTFGEFYPMSFDDRRGEFFGIGGSVYTSDQRQVQIYDIGSDRWKPVSLKDAIAHANIWSTSGAGYSDALKRAIVEANKSAAKRGGFAEKQARYSDPKKLDMQTQFTRTENMFFAHDVSAGLMFLPVFMGQFDSDVIKSDDLAQMADQLLASAFSGQREKMQGEVATARAFVRRWEAEANYSQEFFAALAATNAAKSTADTGKWIGERVRAGAPRAWAPNSKGSLDLPVYDAAYGTFPPGFANYPGFQTVAAAAGYPTEAVDGAKQALKLVEDVTRQMLRVNKNSHLTRGTLTPEWFHVEKAEILVWETLFGRRLPLFLSPPVGVTAGTADNAKSVRSEREDPAIQYRSYQGQFGGGAVGTLPVAALIAAMIFTAYNEATANRTGEVFNGLVQPSAVVGPEKNAQQEQDRTNALNSLIRRILYVVGKGDEPKKYRIVYAVKEIAKELGVVDVAAAPVVDDAFRSKFFALGSEKPSRAALDKKGRGWDAEFAALSQADQTATNAIADSLRVIGFGDVETLNAETENAFPAAKKAELRALLVPTSEKPSTPMTALRDAIETVEKLGRRYGGFSWPGLTAWAESTATRIDDDAVQELAGAVDAYQRASGQFETTWNSVFAAGVKQIAVFEDDDDDKLIGAKKQGAAVAGKRWFFQAPLTMTRNLLYGSTEVGDPLVRASDPATGGRTAFYPQRNPEKRFYEDGGDQILSMGKMPHMLDVGEQELHNFHASSFVQQHVVYPAVGEQAYDGYVAPAHVIATARKLSTGSRYASAGSALKRKADSATAATASDAQKLKRSGYGEPKQQLSAMQQAKMQMQRSLATERDFRSGGDGGDDDDGDYDDKISKSMATGAPMHGTFLSAGANEDEQDDEPPADEDAYPQTPKTLLGYSMMIAGGMMVYRWREALLLDDLQRLAVMSIIFSEASDISTQFNFVDQNVSVPYNILLWRPQITVSMYSLIVMRSGRDTGVNIIGDRNFAMQDSVLDKVMHGHLTFYHKCVVWRPQNVDHILDIYPQKVRSGWDMSWIEKPEELNGAKKHKNSLVAWIHPLGEQLDKTALSFIGGSTARAQPLTTNNPEMSLTTTLTMASFYADYVWKINRARTAYNLDIATFKKSREQINVVAYIGKYIGYDKSTRQFVLMTNGTGHASGVRSGPGTRSVWMGQSFAKFPSAVAVR